MSQNTPVQRLKVGIPTTGLPSARLVTHPWELNRRLLKCDGTGAENRFRLSAKRTSPFKLAGASVLSTTGNRNVRISGINAGYTMFRGSVKGTGYPFHSQVSPSLPPPLVSHRVSSHFSWTLILSSLNVKTTGRPI
jgi:hypothetical protein